MVVDRLENLEKYASLNPLFAKAMEYLKTTDLNAQELGKVKLQGDDLVVNFSQTKPKTKRRSKIRKLIISLLIYRFLCQGWK